MAVSLLMPLRDIFLYRSAAIDERKFLIDASEKRDEADRLLGRGGT